MNSAANLFSLSQAPQPARPSDFDRASVEELAGDALRFFAKTNPHASPQSLAAERELYVRLYRRAKAWRHQHPQEGEVSIRKAIGDLWDEIEAPLGRDSFGDPLPATTNDAA
jgi:hypothetical protein